MSKKVLIVDDNSTMRGTLRGLLQQAGITEVSETQDGETALQMLCESPYDLVISDDEMPSMSGLQLLKAIRADDDLRATPFIMVTMSNSQDKAMAARQAGVSSYIVKPFTADALKSKIERVVGTI